MVELEGSDIVWESDVLDKLSSVFELERTYRDVHAFSPLWLGEERERCFHCLWCSLPLLVPPCFRSLGRFLPSLHCDRVVGYTSREVEPTLLRVFRLENRVETVETTMETWKQKRLIRCHKLLFHYFFFSVMASIVLDATLSTPVSAFLLQETGVYCSLNPIHLQFHSNCSPGNGTSSCEANGILLRETSFAAGEEALCIQRREGIARLRFGREDSSSLQDRVQLDKWYEWMSGMMDRSSLH